jgi:hypothetical protein
MRCIIAREKAIRIQQGQSGQFYVNLPSQSAPSGPTLGNEQEPFDLTNTTQILANFPGGVQEVFAGGSNLITIPGAKGTGKILIGYSALDSSNMQANPIEYQNQDLQVIVSENAIAQIDTLSNTGSPSTGTIYSMTINGQLFAYTAGSTDTWQVVFQALLTAMQTYAASLALNTPPTPWMVSGVISGTGNSATLVLTSTFAGLGFSDVVSNIVKTATQANVGTIAVWLFKFGLDIQPQSFPVI